MIVITMTLNESSKNILFLRSLSCTLKGQNMIMYHETRSQEHIASDQGAAVVSYVLNRPHPVG